MADRFFTAQPLAPGEITLDGPDAHHLAAVRRFQPGDRVTLFNGDGHDYPAEVAAVGKRQVTVNVIDRVAVNREVGFPIVVGSALPKGDRADYLIEKLTEVGATAFVPLACERSVVQPKAEKADKLARGVIEASKQCGRNVLMAIDPPQSLAAYLARTDLPPTRFILDVPSPPLAKGGPGGLSASTPPGPPFARGGVDRGVAFAVGPEGGFSPREVDEAVRLGWRTLNFGPRVLRVETAAVIAVAWAASGG